jgi:hypothetical protein
MLKTKKPPARTSRPVVRERDILSGSFAWGARPWTPICVAADGL